MRDNATIISISHLSKKWLTSQISVEPRNPYPAKSDASNKSRDAWHLYELQCSDVWMFGGTTIGAFYQSWSVTLDKQEQESSHCASLCWCPVAGHCVFGTGFRFGQQ